MKDTDHPHDSAAELRSAGLRVTAARLAILDTVRAGDHLDVEAVTSQVRDRLGHVSFQAVYEALHAFTATGLVRRIEPAGSPARYECRVGDNHHHLVCRECGRLTDVDCAIGEAPCLEPADDADTWSTRRTSPSGACVPTVVAEELMRRSSA